jgi:hypothetical protein
MSPIWPLLLPSRKKEDKTRQKVEKKTFSCHREVRLFPFLFSPFAFPAESSRDL